jgi:hypothetical protein
MAAFLLFMERRLPMRAAPRGAPPRPPMQGSRPARGSNWSGRRW